MEGIRITKFERHPEGGYWTARVHNGDAMMVVHCKYGSWQTEPDTEGRMRDVLAPLSFELTAKMRLAEKHERDAQKALAETNPFVKKANKNMKKEPVAA
jgi:hypothetical protein